MTPTHSCSHTKRLLGVLCDVLCGVNIWVQSEIDCPLDGVMEGVNWREMKARGAGRTTDEGAESNGFY